MKRYTLVCTTCHWGDWNFAAPKGLCPRCKKPALLRGEVLVIPMRGSSVH